jgi:hypothetical protein
MPANLNFEISSVKAGIADPGYSATALCLTQLTAYQLNSQAARSKKIVKKNVLTTPPSFLVKGIFPISMARSKQLLFWVSEVNLRRTTLI